LYHHVRKRALPIHFSDTFAVGFISHICCKMWQHGRVTMAIPDVAFLVVQFCSYTLRHTQYNRPS